jgi:hypothetical protein
VELYEKKEYLKIEILYKLENIKNKFCSYELNNEDANLLKKLLNEEIKIIQEIDLPDDLEIKNKVINKFEEIIKKIDGQN